MYSDVSGLNRDIGHERAFTTVRHQKVIINLVSKGLVRTNAVTLHTRGKTCQGLSGDSLHPIRVTEMRAGAQLHCFSAV